MDIFTFNSPTSPTKLEHGKIVNGLKSKMWIERYERAGEFKFVADVRSGARDVLPVGSLISHTNTEEVMIVENHELNEGRGTPPELIITGRGFETFGENRIVGSNQSFPYVGTFNDLTFPADSIWNQLVLLVKEHTDPAKLLDDNDAIPYFQVFSHIVDAGTTAERVAKRGDLYSRMLEFMKVDDLGVKIVRPGAWSPLSPGGFLSAYSPNPQWNNNVPANTFDGNTTTWWQPTGEAGEKTIEFTLTKAIAMTNIRIQFYSVNYRFVDFVVEVFNGSSWITVVAVGNNGSADLTVDLGGIVTDKFRLRSTSWVSSGSPSTGPAITEVSYTAGDPQNMAMVFHKGIDRSKEVIFSYDTGEIESADYLWSIKKLRNTAMVFSTWMEVLVTTTETNYDRRMMLVDASDIDKGHDLTYVQNNQAYFESLLKQRGEEALASQNFIELTKAEVSKNVVKAGYRIDFNVGDLITVNGDYGSTSKRRISEYVEIEDETGSSAYPTLTTV